MAGGRLPRNCRTTSNGIHGVRYTAPEAPPKSEAMAPVAEILCPDLWGGQDVFFMIYITKTKTKTKIKTIQKKMGRKILN